MAGNKLVSHEYFRQLIVDEGIKPQRFKNNVEAMEAVELMATTCQLGDKTLLLFRGRKISELAAEILLRELMTCFASPLESSRRVIEIGKELREYEK